MGAALHVIGEHKASKGLIRIEFDVVDGRAENVRITGDFFMYPEEAVEELEGELEGKPVDTLDYVIRGFFSGRDVETPGAAPDDFIKALRKALEV
ncbi:MAG: lipoate--protein ligase family protein [Thermococci archaeon]|nr:lipoate--protein ligase family protein [Thermococci archaeon]